MGWAPRLALVFARLEIFMRYEPTREEMIFALQNARKILEEIFTNITDRDVAAFRAIIVERMEKMFPTNINIEEE